MSEEARTGFREFLGAIKAPGGGTSLPFVILAAVIAAGLSLVVGLVVALLTSEATLFRFGQNDESPVTEGLAQAAAFTLAGAELASEDGFTLDIRTTPAVFVVVPIAFSALAAYALRALLAGIWGSWSRVAWGAAVGIPYGLMVLAYALLAGDIETPGGDSEVSIDAAGACFLGILWAGIGGALGAAWGMERDQRSRLRLGGTWGEVAPTLAAALKPLVALLALFAVIGTTVWIVQTIRDAGGIQSGDAEVETPFAEDSEDAGDEFDERPTYQASIEHALYVFDHGVHYTALSGGSSFYAPTLGALLGVPAMGMPLPVDDADDVVDFDALADESEEIGEEFDDETSNDEDVYEAQSEAFSNFLSPDVTFTVFDYEGVVATWVFIALIGLMLLPIVAVVYAGFGVARTRGADGPLTGAVWGAVVGVIWMAALILLNALVQKDFMGKAEPDGLFLVSLLGGIGLGMVGGLIGGQRSGHSR